MKRKIFSKLLMVALVIAAVGSFVSCKDYDDDINNLQKQIDNAALKSSVEALQSTLDSKITAAQNAAAAAQTAADKAAATANAAVTKAQLDDAISAAKTAAATAANEYADKVATAAQTAAAKEAYDQAKKYVDDEVAKVTAAIPSEDAIKAIAAAAAAELDKELATELKTWVNEQIDAIDVEGQVEAAVAKAIEKIDTAAANVSAIWSAITEIEFAEEIMGGVADLNLQWGTQKFTWKFGNKEKELQAYAAMKNPYAYKAGDSIKVENDYIIRVNPVTADLTSASFKLMNTLGEDLNKWVNITVKPYTELFTRAGETGLWVVSVSLRNDVDVADLPKAVSYNKATKKSAVYALAVNNTDTQADRYAVSPFELGVNAGEYEPILTYNPIINYNQTLNQIADRWDSGNKYVKAEDGTIERELPELEWNTADAAADYVPAIDTTAVSTSFKMWQLENNGRYSADGSTILYVEEGDDILIDFTDWTAFVDRYYVLLDTYNAIESNPSETNAWLGYKITGLDELKKSSEKLRIKIDDKEAVGDVIGFRIYATNYDGSLIDPDGKAFYIRYGKENAVEKTNVAGAFSAIVKDATAAAADWEDIDDVLADAKKNDWEKQLNSGLKPFKLSGYASNVVLSNNKGTVTFAYDAENLLVAPSTIGTAAGVVTVNYWLLKDNQGNLASKAGEVAYILASADYAGCWLNNATGVKATGINLTDPDHHNQKVGELNLAITKEMPAAPTTFAWTASREPVNGVLTIYPDPTDKWNIIADAVAGSAKFAPASYGTSSVNPDKFVLKVTKKPKNDTRTILSKNFFATTLVDDIVPKAKEVDADKNFVFNTEYTAAVTYDYAGVSCTLNNDAFAAGKTEQAYSAPLASDKRISKVKFVDKLNPTLQHYAWNSYNYYVGKEYNTADVSKPADQVTKTSSAYFMVYGGTTAKVAGVADAAGTTLWKFANAKNYDVTDWPDATKCSVVAVANLFGGPIKSTNDAKLTAQGNLLTQNAVTSDQIKSWYINGSFTTGATMFRIKVTAGGSEFYKGTILSTGDITLVKNAALTVGPAAAIDGKIEIFAADVFGLNWNADWSAYAEEANQTPIMTLPITLYPTETDIVRP